MEKLSIEVLLIEDDLAQAGIIKELLAESLKPEFSVQHVRYLADGLDSWRPGPGTSTLFWSISTSPTAKDLRSRWRCGTRRNRPRLS